MTDAEVEPFLDKPATTRLHNGSPLIGRLKANGDGTYSVDWRLDGLENQAIVQRFTAAEIASIRLL